MGFETHGFCEAFFYLGIPAWRAGLSIPIFSIEKDFLFHSIMQSIRPFLFFMPQKK